MRAGISMPNHPRSHENAHLQPKEARILVAEDHLLNQDLMKKLLTTLGFQNFDIVDNGEQAINMFRDHDYDLVLMDCHMPDKNGYETTGELRLHCNEVPVVALTADAMEGTEKKCLRAGMDDYLVKPVNVETLRNVLGQWVIFSEEDIAHDIEDNQEDTPEENAEDNGSENMENEAPADISILENFADTPEEMKHFIEVFEQQSEESLSILEEHCKDGVCEQWVEAAHKIKGGASMVGAAQLVHLCELAQAMNEASQEERETLYQSILEEYQTVTAYLEGHIKS